MARTYVDIPFTQDPRWVDDAVRKILIADDYREISYNLETVWKKGTGLMTAIHYIKVEYQGNALRLSGWVQIGVGSVGGKERDLTGFVGFIPKKSVLGTMNRIKAALAPAGGFNQVQA